VQDGFENLFENVETADLMGNPRPQLLEGFVFASLRSRRLQVQLLSGILEKEGFSEACTNQVQETVQETRPRIPGAFSFPAQSRHQTPVTVEADELTFRLQGLPTDGKSITKWQDRDETFTIVAKPTEQPTRTPFADAGMEQATWLGACGAVR
jgi:hypothetical protein